VQGLAWSETKQLFATEHGPSGFPNERLRRGNDELNAIVAGGNYGWPSVAGMGGSRRYRQPLVAWSPAIAPSGLAVYSGDEFPEWKGNVFVGALSGEQLRRIVLERVAGGGWRVVGQTSLFTNLGRVRAVAMAPDGHLYFTVTNRDGRGDPRSTDDRLFRVVRKR
jgi:glucose/arabinose dehydrogenase